MKKVYENISAVKNVYSEKFPQALSILLILFFVVFGTASLFLLINIPA